MELAASLLSGLPTGWLLVCLGIGLIQACAAVRFLRGLGREAASPSARWPAVCVIVPCKGAAPDLAENLRALLRQSYPGAAEYVFVVPRADDPAHEALRPLVSGFQGRARVLVSGAAPRRCSEKCLNLLAGVAAAGPDCEVLLFADSDMRVRPDWMRRMVAPLSDPAAGVCTSAMLYIPEGFELSSWLRLAWMGWAIPWLEPMGCVTGQSLAVRREDFDALGVREAWGTTVSEDLTLAALCRKAGRRVLFVAGAMPVSRGPGGLRATLGLFNRWMTLLRVYDRRIWLAGLLLTALKWAAVARALQAPAARPLLALLAAADMAYLGAVLGGLRRHVPELFRDGPACLRRAPSLAAVAAPALWVVHAVNYAYSLVAPGIGWGGYTYELRGPAQVRAVPGEAAAAAGFARGLRRLGLVLLTGALCGAAYWPGSWGLLAWLVFVPLLWVVSEESAWGALRCGWLFGTAAAAAGVPWLLDSLRRFLGLPQPEPAFWFVLVCCYHGLQWGVACGMARWTGERLSRRWGWDPAVSLAAAFVPAAVAAEGLFPTALPAQLAYTQVFHLPTVQIAEVLGMGALAWLLAGCNAAVFASLKAAAGPPGAARRRLALAAACAGAVLANEEWGLRRMRSIDLQASGGAPLRVGIVQGCLPLRPNLPPDAFSQDLPLHDRLTRESLARGARDLVVWPESTYAGVVSYRGLADPEPAVDGRPLAEVLRRDIRAAVPLLLSAMGRDGAGAARNLSLLTGPNREFWGLSEKMNLVPFGEYLPGEGVFPWLRRLSPRTGRLKAGRRRRVLVLPGKARLGALVCYEDLLADHAARYAALGADLLVNQTNDAWFDQGMAPEQHLRFSVLRAIENRRYLLRAANTGVSAVVDPAGRILGRVERRERGVIAAQVALLEGRTRQGALGRWTYGLALLALPALLLAGKSQ